MKIISDKDLRVATTSGAVVVFKANEAREVSHTIGAIAMQMGARQVGSVVKAPEPIIDAEPAAEVIEEAEGEDEALIAVLQKLIEIGNPEDFKADGTPKAAVVNKALGRTVRTEERERAWEIALNS